MQHFLRIQPVPAPAVVSTVVGMCIEVKKCTIAQSDAVGQSKATTECVLGTINPCVIATVCENWYTTRALLVDQVFGGHNNRLYCDFMTLWHHFLPTVVVVHAADAR